ncbi:MAG TPA: lytic transglycosylase domain-containing protein [Candidatus Aminicenantes bacterium]|nr:lytic transglycosylase domain-containing protein [Candidatus Aminicenantes bacterium]
MANRGLFWFTLLALPTLLWGDIYIYQDGSGRKVISNYTPTDSVKILKVIKTVRHFYNTNLGDTAYEDKIRKFSQREGVDPELVKAIIKTESNFDAGAVSHKGAKGLMQLMTETAKDYGVNVSEIFDPERNLEAGIRHLKRLLDKYNNDTVLALAAYNAGEARVDRYGGIPPFRETQDYVTRITRFYKGEVPLNAPKTVSKTTPPRRKTKVKKYYDEKGVLCISNIPEREG